LICPRQHPPRHRHFRWVAETWQVLARRMAHASRSRVYRASLFQALMSVLCARWRFLLHATF
jgi:hypothetical protein